MTGQPTTPSASALADEAFIAWLTASCQRQGVPVTIRDPAIITQIATLLGAGPSVCVPSTATRTYGRSRRAQPDDFTGGVAVAQGLRTTADRIRQDNYGLPTRPDTGSKAA